MATYTPNLNLGKPEETDPFGNFRQLFNDNMDILDNGGGGGGDSVTWTQIQQSGTKIAEIEINGVTTDVYAPQGAPPFTALIIITADTGSTITATKGIDTYTATEVTTGQYEVTVDSIGTWTISDGTLSDTVTVTAQTTYYVTLSAVPEGSTVLPTDDISIWLACGERTEGYTTLSQVLGDSVCLSALLNNNNANDYLVRSTTWASTITADSSAMSYIGLNNYCANTLLADSTWNEAIQNSEYFELVDNAKVPHMTSNTTPEGEVIYDGTLYYSNYAWHAFDGNGTTGYGTTTKTNTRIGYHFIQPVSITKVLLGKPSNNANRAVKNYKIQASHDGVTWVDVYTGVREQSLNDVTVSIPAVGDYEYWCVYAVDMWGGDFLSFTTIQFYGRKDI